MAAKEAVKTGVQKAVNILLKTNHDVLAILQQSKYEKNLQAEQLATYCRKKLEANIQELISIAVGTGATEPFMVDLEQIPAPPNLKPQESSVAAVDVDGGVDVDVGPVPKPQLGLFPLIPFALIPVMVGAGKIAAAIGTAAAATSFAVKAIKDVKNFHQPEPFFTFTEPSFTADVMTATKIAADLFNLQEQVVSFGENGQLPASIRAHFE